MIMIPKASVLEFEKRLERHKMLISSCDVFFQNIRLLNGRHTILTRDDYTKYYKAFTWDIELETLPLDAFIPCTDDDKPADEPESTERQPKKTKLFVTNQTVPEYGRIKSRVTPEELRQTLGETHPVIVALNDNKVTMDDVIDDIFIYYCLFKYIDQIERIRIQIFSNMTPVIEYVAREVSYEDLNNYLMRSKIDLEKMDKYDDLLFFGPDYQMITKFYMTTEDEFVPKFDLDDLIKRLFTNITIKSDIFIVLGVYLNASYACADMKIHTESEAVTFIRNVASVL